MDGKTGDELGQIGAAAVLAFGLGAGPAIGQHRRYLAAVLASIFVNRHGLSVSITVS